MRSQKSLGKEYKKPETSAQSTIKPKEPLELTKKIYQNLKSLGLKIEGNPKLQDSFADRWKATSEALNVLLVGTSAKAKKLEPPDQRIAQELLGVYLRIIAQISSIPDNLEKVSGDWVEYNKKLLATSAKILAAFIANGTAQTQWAPSGKDCWKALRAMTVAASDYNNAVEDYNNCLMETLMGSSPTLPMPIPVPAPDITSIPTFQICSWKYTRVQATNATLEAAEKNAMNMCGGYIGSLF